MGRYKGSGRRFFYLCREEIEEVAFIREFPAFHMKLTDSDGKTIEPREMPTVGELTAENRDYEMKYMIWTIGKDYTEREYLYNNVALRKVWEIYGYHHVKRIYENG